MERYEEKTDIGTLIITPNNWWVEAWLGYTTSQGLKGAHRVMVNGKDFDSYIQEIDNAYNFTKIKSSGVANFKHTIKVSNGKVYLYMIEDNACLINGEEEYEQVMAACHAIKEKVALIQGFMAGSKCL
jgi:hypothetical protein